MNKKNKLILKSFMLSILLGIIIISCINFVSAEQQSLGNYNPNDCVTLIQTCGSCTYNNITSVIRTPNSTTLLTETAMTKLGTQYTYQFCDTSVLGTYIVNGVGDLDGTATVWAYDFVVGKNPSGGVIVFFSILFLLILAFMTYTILYSIGHAVTLDFDIIDASMNYGTFFALVGFRLLEQVYLGNPSIETFLDFAISIGVWTTLVLPTIYFILTLTVGSWLKKRAEGVGVYK